MYQDRRDAGRRLVPLLAQYRDRSPVVLGLARGGVVVGVEPALALNCPLEPLLVRKIGVPRHEELAAGAIVDLPEPVLVTNAELVRRLGVPESYLRDEADRQRAEIARRRHVYVGERPPVPLSGRAAIVVDDGIATGASARAACRSVRRAEPSVLVLAVPVGATDALADLAAEVDAVICPLPLDDLVAIGLHYQDFHQLDDREVTAALAEANQPSVNGPRV